MIRIGRKARLFYAAITFLASAFGQTGGWTTPEALSAGGQGYEAAAAIDGAGNSLALWDERTSLDQIWCRAKPAVGNWGPVTQVSPALQTTSVFPAVRISAAGFATAVWSDENGVWTADRPPASSWSPAQLLIPQALSPLFAMDAKGDAIIAWAEGGATAPHSTIMAVLRPAGEGWTSPQTVASGVHLAADHVGIGGNGAAIVTWEAFQVDCSPLGCSFFDFVLHASRQDPATTVWASSGALRGPDPDSHDARVALDAAGQAMLVAQSSSLGYTAATQSASGGPWSGFTTIVNPQGISITSDLASDHAGNVTLIYEFIGFSTSQAFAVTSSISSNIWSQPAVVSGNDESVSQIYFAVAPSGVALAIWLNSNSTPEIHAIIRPTASGLWSGPVTVSRSGSSEIGPEAAAVNSLGDAIVIYSGYNADQDHIEYATNFRP